MVGLITQRQAAWNLGGWVFGPGDWGRRGPLGSRSPKCRNLDTERANFVARGGGRFADRRRNLETAVRYGVESPRVK